MSGACVLALWACGAIPQPFRDEDAGRRSLLRLPSAVGVVVDQTAGPSGLAAAMSRALQAAEIPASVAGPAVDPHVRNRLTAAVEATLLEGGRRFVTVLWTLRAGDGRILGEDVVQLTADDALWDEGDPPLLARVVDAPARHFAALLNEDPGPEAASPAPATAIVLPVTGAPPPAAAALRTGMIGALRRIGLPVVEDGPAYRVAGVVTVTPAAAATVHLKVSWSVSGADGRTLGTADQENDVPAAALTGDWGPLPAAITAGGVEGVVEIIERTGGALPADSDRTGRTS